MTTALYHGIRRNLSRWVKTETGGHSEPAGHEFLTVRVDVDMKALAEKIGKQAAGNKNGVSKFMHGLIRVEVVERSKP